MTEPDGQSKIDKFTDQYGLTSTSCITVTYYGTDGQLEAAADDSYSNCQTPIRVGIGTVMTGYVYKVYSPNDSR